MEKYIIDPKVKKYLIKSAYKETPYWKSGKKKRVFAYRCLAVPIPIYFIALGIDLLKGTPFDMAIIRSFAISLTVMLVTGTIGIISLKAQYWGAKIVPEDRKNDEIILDKDYMIYSYSCLSDGYMHEIRIKYRDVLRFEYSDARKTLYIFCGHYNRVSSGSQLVEARNFGKELGLYVDVPMYFKDSDSFQQQLSSLCGKEIEIIERL